MLRATLFSLLMPAALMAQALPSGEAVLDRFIEVTGGKKAYETKHSMVTKGTMYVEAMGLKGTMTIYKAEPNLMLTEVEFAGVGKMLDGFDGQHAWSYSAIQGPNLKQGEEREQSRRLANFHEQNWKEVYAEVKTLGVENVGDEPCHKVVATLKQGNPITMFYSVKTGFLVKQAMKVATAMGEMEAETLLKDYKNVGGIWIPHVLEQRAAGQVFTITTTSVEWNVEIPKTRFAPPAEVKALIKK
ncbi:MAG: DUF620 domain-containing protein [Firmicutes bacterium]|nr:DUF620 domain-containing protein [Bacillota bacterium]